jgi:hypothetical protein
MKRRRTGFRGCRMLYDARDAADLAIAHSGIARGENQTGADK